MRQWDRDPLEGVFVDVPQQSYRYSVGLNPSAICDGFLGDEEFSVAAVTHSYEHSTPPSDRMIRGTITHLAAYQPYLLDERVAVWDGGRRFGKDWEEFKSNNQGKILARRQEYQEAVVRFQDLLSASALLRDHLPRPDDERSMREVVLYATEAGLQTKGQCDSFIRRGPGEYELVDLKTTADIRWSKIKSVIRDLHYREKAYLYKRWFERLTPHSVTAVKKRFRHVRRSNVRPRCELHQAGYGVGLRNAYCRRLKRWQPQSNHEYTMCLKLNRKMEFELWECPVTDTELRF